MSCITLGFVEAKSPCRLVSHLFPDKIGGRPAWLAMKNLPDNLECLYCQQPMAFLMQIYSPLDEREDCFHRMLFVFMCKNGECFQPQEEAKRIPFRVFRSQLPKENPYYSTEAPNTTEMTEEAMTELIRSGLSPNPGVFMHLCPICGGPGSICCSHCNKAYYCSKGHQAMHWKQRHKSTCPEYDYLEEIFKTNSFLLPEFGLTSETLDEKHNDANAVYDSGDDSGGELIEDPTYSNEEKEEFAALEGVSRKETKEERAFFHFKDILKKQPDQVVRFDRGGSPLWITTSNIKPPPCSICGGQRIFEFQITPQLLSYLKLDKVGESSPDFGTVYIFTCENSCPLAFSGAVAGLTSKEYAEEFVTFDPVP